MKIGHVYKIVKNPSKTCSECHQEVKTDYPKRFPFNSLYGIFTGTLPGGFLSFRLSGEKYAAMNGGCYEEVNADVRFEVKNDEPDQT